MSKAHAGCCRRAGAPAFHRGRPRTGPASTEQSRFCWLQQKHWASYRMPLPRVATAFGGGLSRQGHVCGAVTGGLMAIGLALGRRAKTDSKEPAYAAGVELQRRFLAAFGTLNCRDLTGCDLSTPEGQALFEAQEAELHLLPSTSSWRRAPWWSWPGRPDQAPAGEPCRSTRSRRSQPTSRSRWRPTTSWATCGWRARSATGRGRRRATSTLRSRTPALRSAACCGARTLSRVQFQPRDGDAVVAARPRHRL